MRLQLLAESNAFGTDPISKKAPRSWSPLALSEGKLFMRGQDELIYLNLRK